MEERIQLKIDNLRKNYVQRYQIIIFLLSFIPFCISLVILLFVGLPNFGLQGLPGAILKIVALFAIVYFMLSHIILREFRCLNSKRYNYLKAYVADKRYDDEHIEFVGVENKMRKFPKEYYVLLGNEKKYAMAKSWTYRDIKVGETYLFAFTGNKRTKRSIIVCAMKIEN